MTDTFIANMRQGGWVLGDWHYWPDSGLLKSKKAEHRLSTQLNQVMMLLLEKSPRVVTRQQFLDHVWAEKIVNEDALSRTIAELRKVLGDSASEAKFIKTIPKKGYQLTQVAEPIVEKNTRRLKTLAAVLIIGIWLFMANWNNQQSTVVDDIKTAVANASRFTAQPGMEQQSIVSDDGGWLSYIKNNNANSQIIIESLSEPGVRHVVELAEHRLSSPVYLPLQKMVYFLALDEANCYLKSHHLGSKEFTDLAGCIFNAESRTLDWNKDQQYLLFTAMNDHKMTGIHRVDILTGDRHELTSPVTTSEQDWSPRTSPNNQWISFSRGNHSVRNLWLKNLETGLEQPLTAGQHYSISHEWYDDEHIVFDSDLSGSRQLWLLNIHTKEPQLIGAYGAQHPSFDEARQVMTFQVVSYEANIWMFDVNAQMNTRIIHSTKYDNYPQFSPDGQKFLFSSNRQDQNAIWMYDFIAKKEQSLLSIPGAKLTRPVWHTKNNEILMTINDSRGYGTLILDLTTMQTRELSFGQGHFATVQYNDEYFALAKSSQLSNQILHLKDQKVSLLPVESVARMMVLADGRLIYSKSDQTGLFIYDLVAEQELLLTPLLRRSATNYWTVVNESVYFDRSDPRAGIWKINVNSKELEFVTANRPLSVGSSLSVNKAENLILITHTDRAESDILQTKLDNLL